jgi:hypothetical protein
LIFTDVPPFAPTKKGPADPKICEASLPPPAPSSAPCVPES